MKKYLRNDDNLNYINNSNHNKTRLKSIFLKIKKEELHTIKELEQVFFDLEAENHIHEKNYNDNSKLSFYINYFNLKIMHELFFRRLAEGRVFPPKLDDWIKFLSNVEFKLFGIQINLMDLYFSIIR